MKSEWKSFLKDQGVVRARDLLPFFKSRTSLSRVVSRGELVSLGAGFYCCKKISPVRAKWLAIAKYFPEAVLSGRTALSIHGLLQPNLNTLTADIPRSITYKNTLASFRRVKAQRLFGVIEHVCEDIRIKTYSLERSLAEVYFCDIEPLDREYIFSQYLNKNSVSWETLKEISSHLEVPLFEDMQIQFASAGYIATPQKDREDSQDLSLRQRMIGSGIIQYSRAGQAGLCFEEVAREAGVTIDSIHREFNSVTEFKEEVLNVLQKQLQSNFPGIMFGFKTIDELKGTLRGLLDATDEDEVAYRIIRWAIAEQNSFAKTMVENLCGSLLHGIVNLLVNIQPALSTVEAEVRAGTLVSAVDSYMLNRWFYADHLNLKSSKAEYLSGLKAYISDTLVEQML